MFGVTQLFVRVEFKKYINMCTHKHAQIHSIAFSP